MFLDDLRKFFLPHLWKTDEPEAHAPIKYDPDFGFPEPRPYVRVTATEQEMDSANLYYYSRDECAYYHIAYQTCLRSNAPLWWKCNGFKNEVANCYYELRIHDMKEFEREKRLNARERKLASS